MEQSMDGRESNITSSKVGDYQINNVQVDTQPIYQASPSIVMQKIGGATVNKGEFTDVQSEILNITRPNSNDPSKKWIPQKTNLSYINMPEGVFTQSSTLLDNPPMLLRGNTKNRWIDLHLDPQENVIESFERNGQNTHLTLIDNYNC